MQLQRFSKQIIGLMSLFNVLCSFVDELWRRCSCVCVYGCMCARPSATFPNMPKHTEFVISAISSRDVVRFVHSLCYCNIIHQMLQHGETTRFFFIVNNLWSSWMRYLNSASGLTFASRNINKYNCFHIDCECVQCPFSNRFHICSM